MRLKASSHPSRGLLMCGLSRIAPPSTSSSTALSISHCSSIALGMRMPLELPIWTKFSSTAFLPLVVCQRDYDVVTTSVASPPGGGPSHSAGHWRNRRPAATMASHALLLARRPAVPTAPTLLPDEASAAPTTRSDDRVPAAAARLSLGHRLLTVLSLVLVVSCVGLISCGDQESPQASEAAPGPGVVEVPAHKVVDDDQDSWREFYYDIRLPDVYTEEQMLEISPMARRCVT